MFPRIRLVRQPPPKLHPGPHHLRLQNVLPWAKEQKRSLRFLVGELARVWSRLPGWAAILGANVVGCILIGLVAARLRASGKSDLEATPQFPRLRQKGWALGPDPTLPAVDLFRANQNLLFLSALLMTGVLGSFTTFSAFSLETVALLQQARLVEASLNVAGSLGVCLVAVVSGLYIGQRRTPQR